VIKGTPASLMDTTWSDSHK